jgi:endonuclease/exonuclease/phosphatase family metal-dependent hydrolase
MRIGTFNIWNHDKDYHRRMDLLVELLIQNKLDLIVMQEVRDEYIVNRLASECGFEFTYWKKYFDCQEGLAVLSRYRIDSFWTNWDDNQDIHNSGLMYVRCEVNKKFIDIMNIHLDYEKASHREIEILKAIKYLEGCDGEYKFLLGDFNTTQNSSVYRYLTGGQSLNGEDTNWLDLPETHCYRQDIELEPTIDFIKNPRWLGTQSLEVPARFDWILIKEPYPSENPILQDYKILGDKVVDGITPSDHYGVMVEVDLPWI